MRYPFLLFILCCTLLLHISCINCRTVDCQGPTGFIEVRLVKDGHNAVFGPDATVDADSIRFYSPGVFQNEVPIYYNDVSLALDLYIEHGATYILEIKNVRSDTIIGMMEVTGMGECCEAYDFTNVTINGQVVCQAGCDEVIEVQL